MIRLLKLLIFLNIFDGVATYVCIKIGFIKELNPIMADIIEGWLSTLIFKITLPTILILWLINHLQKQNMTKFKVAKFLIVFTSIIYGGVSLLHIFNILIYWTVIK